MKLLLYPLLALSLLAQAVPNTVAATDGSGNAKYGTVGDSLLTSTSAFGNTAVRVCHAQYSFANDGGGSPGTITPTNNCTLPAKSILFGSLINWTTAAVGALNTTSIGTTGTGSSTTAIMPATAVASLTGFVTGAVTFASPLKITTSGTVTLTTNTAALTAGVCEIFVFYVVSPT